MSNVFTSYLLVIAFCFMLVLAGPLDAVGLNLELGTGIGSDGNVFRTPEHAVRDSFITFAPALYAQYFSSRTSLRLDAKSVSQWYLQHTEVNFHQITLNGQARYNLSGHLSLEIKDELTDVRNVRQPTVGELATLFSYIANQISPSLKYERSSGMTIAMGYSNERRDYRDIGYTWDTNNVTFSFLYPLGDKATAQLLLGLKSRVFEADISYLSRSAIVGMSWRLPLRFGAKARFGWEDRTYDNAYQDIRSFLIDIHIDGELLRRIPIALGLRRTVTDSEAHIGQALIPLDGAFSVSRDLTSRIRLEVEGVIGSNSYPNLERSDVRFFGKLQLGYRMVSWGTFYLTYEYEQMKSQEEEYRQGQIGVSLVGTVPFLQG